MVGSSPTQGHAANRLHVIAGFALCAAVVQLISAVLLELASPRALASAHARGAQWFYLGLAIIAVAVLGFHLLRERPGTGFVFAAGTLGLGAVYLRTRVDLLNLAVFAEPTTYHFVALLSAAVISAVAIEWLQHPQLKQLVGRRRAVPAVLASVAAVLLVLEHLAGTGSLGEAAGALLTRDSVAGLARLCALSAWGVATWLFWGAMRPHSARWVPLFATALLVTRVVAAGPRGLVGATVVDNGATMVGAVFVMVALATAVAVRPRVELLIHGIVGIASMGACMLFLWLYYRAYGNIEDGLGDILRSLFAFDVPLPYGQNPGWWKPAVVMVGVFFLLYTTYAAIVLRETRARGVAIALMALAGLNLASPYLVLLLAAGGMMYVDTLLWPPGHAEAVERGAGESSSAGEAEGNASARLSLGETFEAVAERLAFEAPIQVDSGRSKLWAMSGTIGAVAIDMRGREGGRERQIELTCGVLGHDSPLLALIWDPGEHGQRPAHPAARDYRVEGELRHLEALGDRPLDALSAFRGATMHCWEAGVMVQFDREDPALDTDHVEALVRAAARAARPA